MPKNATSQTNQFGSKLTQRKKTQIYPYNDPPLEEGLMQQGQLKQAEKVESKATNFPQEHQQRPVKFEELLAMPASLEKELQLDFFFDEEGNLVEPRPVGPEAGPQDMSPESVSDEEDDNGEPFFGSGQQGASKNNLYLRKYMDERRKLQRLQAQTKVLMARMRSTMNTLSTMHTQSKGVSAENRELKEKLESLKYENEELALQLESQRTAGATRITGAPKLPRSGQNLESINAMRRAAFRGLFNIGEAEDDAHVLLSGDKKGWFQRFKERMYRSFQRKMPFNSEIKAIEARFGSSVAAYFIFFQWLITQYILVMTVFIPTAILHLVNMVNGGARFRDMFKFYGILPHFMLFSSYTVEEKGLYGWLLISVMLFMAAITLYKWIAEDRQQKISRMEEDNDNQAKFSKLFLCSWDHSLVSREEVLNMKLSLGQTVIVSIEEEKIRKVQNKRTTSEVVTLVIKRGVGAVINVGLQALAWATIIYLTFNKTIEQWFQKHGFSWLASSVVPAVVSGINAIMPIAISAIVKLESWDSAKMNIKQLTTRMYIAKVLNALIQVFSYFLLVDPLLCVEYAEIRASLEIPFSTKGGYKCRADQVGSGLFQLVVTDFVICKVIALGTEAAYQLQSKLLRTLHIKEEFETAKSMVSLLYFAALGLASVFLAPNCAIIFLILLVLGFMFDSYILKTFRVKPKRPWKAEDAGAFFIKFYLATVVVGCFCVWYLLISTTLPKSCSIQDQSVHLCSPNSLNVTMSLICYMDPYSSGFHYMQRTCPSDYPACICQGSLACGPYILDNSAWEPLAAQLKSTLVLGQIFTFLQKWSLVVWIVVVAVFLALFFKKNSYRVIQHFTFTKDKMWQASVQTLEAKVRKLQKTVDSLQMQIQSTDPTTMIEPFKNVD